jgi:hypothetical protein
VEDEEEKKQLNNRIFQQKYCISEVKQSATDSNSSSVLEVLYTVIKDCIQDGKVKLSLCLTN